MEIELKKINDLYSRCCDCMDELFVNEMIGAFGNIIEKQRARISDLEMEAEGTLSVQDSTASSGAGYSYGPASGAHSVLS